MLGQSKRLRFNLVCQANLASNQLKTDKDIASNTLFTIWFTAMHDDTRPLAPAKPPRLVPA
jgi:hypothetical protein